MAELIQAQLDEASGQGVCEVDILNKDIGDDNVMWSDEEEERGLDADGAGEEKTWSEADCRITLNVRSTLRYGVPADDAPARCSDIYPHPTRSHRMGPILVASTPTIRQIILRRSRSYR
jgi:hypothetical protein